MPCRNWEFRIQDILDSVGVLNGYLSGMTYADFTKDQRTIDAVIRRLTVIGEAAARIPDSVLAENPDIPWKEMRAMRNYVIHEYFGISEDILWNTVQIDIPGIVEPLQKLLEQNSLSS